MCSRKMPILFWLLLGDIGFEASWRFSQGPKFFDEKWKLLVGHLRINAFKKICISYIILCDLKNNKFTHTQRF